MVVFFFALNKVQAKYFSAKTRFWWNIFRYFTHSYSWIFSFASHIFCSHKIIMFRYKYVTNIVCKRSKIVVSLEKFFIATIIISMFHQHVPYLVWQWHFNTLAVFRKIWNISLFVYILLFTPFDILSLKPFIVWN